MLGRGGWDGSCLPKMFASIARSPSSWFRDEPLLVLKGSPGSGSSQSSEHRQIYELDESDGQVFIVSDLEGMICTSS